MFHRGESGLARRFAVQGHGRVCGALALLFGCQMLQLFGAADHWAGMRVLGLPLAQVLKKAVYIAARLGGQLVFDPPDLKSESKKQKF